MLNLPYLDVPNPYYTALKMKLYYEYMIVENLPKVQEWRDFKRKKNAATHKDHMDWKRSNKLDKKIHQTILALEIEFRRETSSNKASISREDIENRYITDPLMQRYLNDKTKLSLGAIVDLIDSGKSKDAAKTQTKKEKQAKHARTPEGREARTRQKTLNVKKKGKKKDKKATNKDKERGILEARRANLAKSTLSNKVKDGGPMDDQEYEKKRKLKVKDKIKQKVKKLNKKKKYSSDSE